MLSKRTGLTTTALTAGLALALSACGGGNSASTGASSGPAKVDVAKGGTLKVLSEEDVTTLDTADAYDTASYSILRSISRQLYQNPAGNSVKGSNVADLLAQPDIDGALVGGASLSADDFARICRLGQEDR